MSKQIPTICHNTCNSFFNYDMLWMIVRYSSVSIQPRRKRIFFRSHIIKSLHWKFDAEKRVLYLSGTDVPGNQGSALSEIKDLVSVAKTIVIDKDFVPPLGTDLTTWTNYYLKSTSNRDIYHNVFLYRGSLSDLHIPCTVLSQLNNAGQTGYPDRDKHYDKCHDY